MANPKKAGRAPRRRLPLTVRLSLLVLFAAILPLAAVVGVNDYFARGTLVSQGTNALANDAAAKSNLIRQYMLERVLDGEALASLPTAQDYLACLLPQLQQLPALDCANNQAANAASVTRAINVGMFRDTNYAIWSIYDTKGQLKLSTNAAGEQGSTAALAEDLAALQSAKGAPVVSPVYYDPQTKHALVRIYAPVFFQVPGANQLVPVGFLRATLRMDYIYNVVNGENGANGHGSYAFMVDSNGVRIADAHSDGLFTAVQPLSASAEQQIAAEQRYGSATPVTVESLPGVASTLTTSSANGTFQSPDTPGSNMLYQYARESIPSLQIKTPVTTLTVNLGWSYFSLSPLSTVTLVADDQLKTSLLSAGVVAILAILLGLLIGRRTASPVQAASGEVEGAAVALKLLAARQESSASEQQWVVDACKTGLDGVRYLSDAMNQAARRIMDASNWFNDYWDRLTEDQAKRTVQHLLELSRYVDEAARRQQASSERLDKAITVTIQVSDQLVAGAAAATQSADALEQVVSNLQRVVGGRPRLVGGEDTMDEAEQLEQIEAMALVPQAIAAPAGGAGGQRSSRLALPMPQGPRGGAGMGMPGGQMMGAPGPYAPRAPRAPWNAGQPSQVFDDPYGQPGGYAGYDQWDGERGNGAGYPAAPRSQGQQGGGRNGRG
jgi:hypothetical protein